MKKKFRLEDSTLLCIRQNLLHEKIITFCYKTENSFTTFRNILSVISVKLAPRYQHFSNFVRVLLCGNRNRELIEIRTDSPSCNREPVGLSNQEPARNGRLVWLCSRHEGWSGTGQATRPFSGCFSGGFLVALKFHLIHNRTHHPCILLQFFELFSIFSADTISIKHTFFFIGHFNF